MFAPLSPLHLIGNIYDYSVKRFVCFQRYVIKTDIRKHAKVWLTLRLKCASAKTSKESDFLWLVNILCTLSSRCHWFCLQRMICYKCQSWTLLWCCQICLICLICLQKMICYNHNYNLLCQSWTLLAAVRLVRLALSCRNVTELSSFVSWHLLLLSKYGRIW